MEATLKEIYETNLNYLARWNTSLANHVTMAAAAMYLMREKTGVSSDKVCSDAISYSKQLSPKRTNDAFVQLTDLPWSVQQQLLGYDDLQESWQAFFEQELEHNLDVVVQKWLERLGFGLSAAAGHSIIRIHYAIAVREVLSQAVLIEELAVSFADLASRHTVMTDSVNVEGEGTLEGYLEDHSLLPAQVAGAVKKGTLIEDRMLILRTCSDYQLAARGIALDFDFGNCLRRLASMVTESADFTLLHAITVGQALLDLTTWYPKMNDLSLRQGYRDFVIAAVLGNHLPNAILAAEDSISIEEVYDRTRHLGNDHAQKATYSLTRLYEEFKFPELLRAARFYQEVYR